MTNSACSLVSAESGILADVVDDLESSVQCFRDKLTSQCDALELVASHMRRVADEQGGEEWLQLVQEVLLPAQKLSGELTAAYDRLRTKIDDVKSAHGRRTDRVTGLGNEYAMQEWLQVMFALMSRYCYSFSLVIVDFDREQERSVSGRAGMHRLSRDIAKLLTRTMREADFQFRLDNGQFAIALPETNMEGAVNFSRRVQREISKLLSWTTSIGVALARDDDNKRSLIDRAQAAVFAAESAGGNVIFRHTGRAIESVS